MEPQTVISDSVDFRTSPRHSLKNSGFSTDLLIGSETSIIWLEAPGDDEILAPSLRDLFLPSPLPNTFIFSAQPE